MKSTSISKITTGALSVLLAASIGIGLHQSNATAQAEQNAAAWQAEAAGWQDIAGTANRRNAQLTRKYNRLVRTAKTNERKLVQALEAQPQGGGSSVPQTTAIQASTITAPASAPAPAADPAPVAQPAPAATPTSQAS